MAEIIVYTTTRFPEGDSEDLLNEIDNIDPENKIISTSPEQRGFGVTWEEFITIWVLSTAVNTLVSEVVKVCVEWAKRRYERDKPKVRPKVIRIYGPDGKIVSAFRMDH